MEQVSAKGIDIKVKRKWNEKTLLKALLITLIIGYIGFIAVSFITQTITQRLIKVENIKNGVLKDYIEVKGILLKDETIINSPYNGKIKHVFQEGERVRLGALVSNIDVADINSRSGQSVFDLNAPIPGVVSYHFDGLENLYSLSNIDVLMIKQVEKLDDKTMVVKDGANVETGRPVYKIVNNLARNQIYFHIPQNKAANDLFKKGNRIEVEFVGTNIGSMAFVIDELKGSGSDYIVVIGNNSFIPQFLDKREIKIKIVTKSVQGAIVPVKSLVKSKTKDGSYKDGIYIEYKEEVKWQQVNLIGKVKDKAAITGLDEETPYIVNPERTKVGQVIGQ